MSVCEIRSCTWPGDTGGLGAGLKVEGSKQTVGSSISQWSGESHFLPCSRAKELHYGDANTCIVKLIYSCLAQVS